MNRSVAKSHFCHSRTILVDFKAWVGFDEPKESLRKLFFRNLLRLALGNGAGLNRYDRFCFTAMRQFRLTVRSYDRNRLTSLRDRHFLVANCRLSHRRKINLRSQALIDSRPIPNVNSRLSRPNRKVEKSILEIYWVGVWLSNHTPRTGRLRRLLRLRERTRQTDFRRQFADAFQRHNEVEHLTPLNDARCRTRLEGDFVGGFVLRNRSPIISRNEIKKGQF
jgi:hypothetical protein